MCASCSRRRWCAASHGVAALLALAQPRGPTGASARIDRESQALIRRMAREHRHLGRGADRRRAPGLWHRGARLHGAGLPAAGAASPALTPVAHLPPPAWSRDQGLGFLHRADAHLSHALRLRRDQPRSVPSRALECDGPPDQSLGLATGDRGDPVERATPVSDSRPGSGVWRRLRPACATDWDGNRADACAAPQANAIAERVIRTIRQDCLDHVIVLNERHLRRLLGAFVPSDNRSRPHRSLDLEPPTGPRARAPARRTPHLTFRPRWIASRLRVGGVKMRFWRPTGRRRSPRWGRPG